MAEPWPTIEEIWTLPAKQVKATYHRLKYYRRQGWKVPIDKATQNAKMLGLKNVALDGTFSARVIKINQHRLVLGKQGQDLIDGIVLGLQRRSNFKIASRCDKKCQFQRVVSLYWLCTSQ